MHLRQGNLAPFTELMANQNQYSSEVKAKSDSLPNLTANLDNNSIKASIKIPVARKSLKLDLNPTVVQSNNTIDAFSANSVNASSEAANLKHAKTLTPIVDSSIEVSSGEESSSEGG